ncbi:telomere repeats-binding bouquet formation protein 1-like [Ornithorhynchus anatinus]|uniref:telomere repeats-binding bouquet formation protein 1-like n=1 Tax=Ornithorhynchus anatinus TaxID=9258 RepID=UPI0010A76745|nr:telomere repeats-binding bouquet formation protein 1-like [Ornithorhynchus anatinus]XP_028913161.1 telomere repeats-binding bouquet formation protein 1-like [Ornithorhynchus anatinus]XP_028913163.1 telomere repeats-binding bouquet formation protein 1-like [Ornithorhynchus anatinus]
MQADIDLDILLQRIEQNLDNFPVVKHSLLSIISVCQGNISAGVHFEYMGGLKSLHNLVKSDVPSMIKEAALYTLGSLADINAVCQKSLCTAKYFKEIMTFIVDKNSSMKLQIMSVCLLLALVSKNETGQIFLRESGCFPVLQNLFRVTIVTSEIDFSDETFKRKHHLWYAVCNTLCAAVSCPRNEENQNICSSLLPHAWAMLEASLTPEILCPICLFIGVTVTGNTSVQKSFTFRGGLDVLADILTKLAGVSHLNISNVKMAVAVTNAIGACIVDNGLGGIVVAKHQVVPKLLTLLVLETLNSEEKASILVTLGRCIETCGENLNLLLQNNGIKLIVDSFSEAQYEVISNIIIIVMLNSKIFAEKLLGKFFAYVSQGISALENQSKVGGDSKKTKDTLPKEQLQKKGNKDRGSKKKAPLEFLW